MDSTTQAYGESVLLMPRKRGRPRKNTKAVVSIDIVTLTQQASASTQVNVPTNATTTISVNTDSSSGNQTTISSRQQSQSARKRKATNSSSATKKAKVARSRKGKAVATTTAETETSQQPALKKERKTKERKTKERKTKERKPKEERRTRGVIRLPPEASIYLSAAMRGRVLRAMKQKMFVLSRQLSPEDDSIETFDVIGSIGNNYKVCIGHTISCECMDYRIRRTHCKHILMVLLKIYHLPYNSPLFKSMRTNREQRLLARSTSRMVDPSVLVPIAIRERILRMTQPDHPDLATAESKEKEEEDQGNRRPLDTSDCPICFEAFEEQAIATVDFCKVCGNNIHIECFNMWKESKGRGNVTCVYCRSAWVFPEAAGNRGSKRSVRDLDFDHVFEGVPNFAKELGLVRNRDKSTYSRGPHYGYNFDS